MKKLLDYTSDKKQRKPFLENFTKDVDENKNDFFFE